MENLTFIEVEGYEHVVIDRGNGEFTSMLKSVYDELQKTVVIDEPAAKSK